MNETKLGQQYPLRAKHKTALEASGVTVGKVINSGKYGHVCEATITLAEEKTEVAVKIVELEQTSDQYVQHFLPQELEAMRSLEHPFIVCVHKIWSKDKTIYVFMEKALGGDLIDMLETLPEGIPEDRAKQLYKGVVSALQYIHDKGFAHRDIKCENVLLMDKERTIAKLTDFGFSTFIKVPTTGQRVLSKTNCGTPYYSPPEIYNHEPYDATKMDIFSLGVVLYAMVNNEMPFTDIALINSAKDSEKKLDLTFKNKNLSKNLVELIENQLRGEPKQRPSIAQVFNHAWLH